MLGKYQQTIFEFFFLIFPRKLVMTFHANFMQIVSVFASKVRLRLSGYATLKQRQLNIDSHSKKIDFVINISSRYMKQVYYLFNHHNHIICFPTKLYFLLCLIINIHQMDHVKRKGVFELRKTHIFRFLPRMYEILSVHSSSIDTFCSVK